METKFNKTGMFINGKKVKEYSKKLDKRVYELTDKFTMGQIKKEEYLKLLKEIKHEN